MPSDITIDADAFAMTVTGMLENVENYLDGRMEKMIDTTCSYTKDIVEVDSPKRFGGYAKGWSYKMKSSSTGVVGEVGNKKYPGLVHLLEKGHARVGGGRVRAIPHVSTAYAEGAKMLNSLADAAVEEAIAQ